MTRSEIKQLELLRAKTPEQRFTMMADLIGAQFEAMKAGNDYDCWTMVKYDKIRLYLSLS